MVGRALHVLKLVPCRPSVPLGGALSQGATNMYILNSYKEWVGFTFIGLNGETIKGLKIHLNQLCVVPFSFQHYNLFVH